MSHRNSVENQSLRTFDIISLFFLLFLVSCSIGFVLSRRGDASKLSRAEIDMKHLSHQILDEGLTPLGSRSPASANNTKNIEKPSLDMEGRIAKDPWGHAYYYKVINGETGAMAVVVWSSGPDGVPETRDWDLRLGSGKDAVAINYRGDDMGYFTR